MQEAGTNLVLAREHLGAGFVKPRLLAHLARRH